MNDQFKKRFGQKLQRLAQSEDGAKANWREWPGLAETT